MAYQIFELPIKPRFLVIKCNCLMHLKPYHINMLCSSIIYIYLFKSYVGEDDVFYTLYKNFYVKLTKKKKTIKSCESE